MKTKLLIIIVTITFSLVIPQAFGEMATGKPAWETNSEKVCGDRLCSEISSEDGTLQVRGGIISEKINSPRKQMAEGTSPGDVICKEGRVLIIKHNGSAACVRLDTAVKLEELGWGGPCCKPTQVSSIDSFEECVAAGNPVMESYPRQCRTLDGKHFVESITTQAIPASSGTVVNFYVNDDDLNISPYGIDVINTAGLIEATINGIAIDIPSEMSETSPNSGKFFLRIDLPEIINGRPLNQDDIVIVRYIDQSDAAGQIRVTEESFTLGKSFAKLQTQQYNQRIGHEFTFRIFEPDANRDSKDEDKISLGTIEFRSEGGIRTYLSNPAFDANSSNLIETGPNTGIFEVIIKIPRTIDGKTVHIGDWFEFRYFDVSTPSETTEKIVLKGKIG